MGLNWLFLYQLHEKSDWFVEKQHLEQLKMLVRFGGTSRLDMLGSEDYSQIVVLYCSALKLVQFDA